MTTLKIVVDHEGYNGPSVGYAPVVTKDLACWHFPKVSADKTVVNFADSGPGSMVGNPAFTPSYMSASGMTDYLQTDAYETGDITILAVGRTKAESGAEINANANAPIFGGNFELSTRGLYLGYRSGGTPEQQLIFRRVLEDGTNTATSITAVSYVANEFHFVAASAADAENGGEHAVYHKTAGLKSTEINDSSAAALNPEPITAGGIEETYGGDTDIAFFAVYNRLLSEDEVDAVYQQVKTYLAARNGISI